MSGSVSMVDGHIDPDKNKMTPQEALAWVEDYEKAIKEEQAIVNNGDEFHVEALKVCEVVRQALEKQIPKKPKTETINRGIDISGEYDIDSNYICSCCGAIVGDYETEEHYYNSCINCSQAIDWSDAE